MKAYQFIYRACLLILVLPMLSHAEIYKWTEKNGTVRYSDTPPPANIKPEKIIKKSEPKKIESTAPEKTATPDNKAVPVNPNNKKLATPDDLDKDMKAARARQQQAEADKNKKQESDEQTKIKEQNCTSARASLETYKQGGRISQVNENGEKSYMGDQDIKAGLEKAQADVDQYCN